MIQRKALWLHIYFNKRAKHMIEGQILNSVPLAHWGMYCHKHAVGISAGLPTTTAG